nr:neuromedin-U [Loxodonta africana]
MLTCSAGYCQGKAARARRLSGPGASEPRCALLAPLCLTGGSPFSPFLSSWPLGLSLPSYCKASWFLTLDLRAWRQTRVAIPGQPAAQVPLAGRHSVSGLQLKFPDQAPWRLNRDPGAGQAAVGGNLLWTPADSGFPSPCGAPILPQGLQPEQELQLWNEIGDACSSFLFTESRPQASKALEELCFTIMGILPKPQDPDEKDNTKRFLFHYSKTQKLGNSNVVSSVVHPLLQLIPQLHQRRMKRFKVDGEFQRPVASRSQGFFLFRPRNGRRSAGFN